MKKIVLIGNKNINKYIIVEMSYIKIEEFFDRLLDTDDIDILDLFNSLKHTSLNGKIDPFYKHKIPNINKNDSINQDCEVITLLTFFITNIEFITLDHVDMGGESKIDDIKIMNDIVTIIDEIYENIIKQNLYIVYLLPFEESVEEIFKNIYNTDKLINCDFIKYPIYCKILNFVKKVIIDLVSNGINIDIGYLNSITKIDYTSIKEIDEKDEILPYEKSKRMTKVSYLINQGKDIINTKRTVYDKFLEAKEGSKKIIELYMIKDLSNIVYEYIYGQHNDSFIKNHNDK